MEVERALAAPAPRSCPYLSLFWISALGLFLEIALIRWLPGNIRVLAYYANAILISCFLGLGLGCSLAGSPRNWMALFPFTMPLLVAVTLGFERTNDPVAYARVLAGAIGVLGLLAVAWLWRRGPAGRRWAAGILLAALALAGTAELNLWTPGAMLDTLRRGYFAWGSGHRASLWFVLVPFVFLLNGLSFLAIGQELGRGFVGVRPLPAYSVNILGSLAGIGAFSALCFWETPPVVWFGIGFAMALAYLRKSPRLLAAGVVTLGGALALIQWTGDPSIVWSPYSKVTQGDGGAYPGGGFSLNVNDDYHQLALNLSPAQVAADPKLEGWRNLYDLPYCGPGRPGRVLVVGAGTGNDVAAALRAGAEHVDAVEIDPVIARLGGDHHPERPYADRRVRLILTDARGHLRNTREQYDRIVYGFLDSHSLFSSMTSLRLDNFVYTHEALCEARDRLAPGGRLALSFFTGKPWIAEKLFRLLALTFGRAPATYFTEGGYGAGGVVFVVGREPAELDLSGLPLVRPREIPREAGVDLPTDDWPHLYVRSRGLSNEYVRMLLLLTVLAMGACGFGLSRAKSFSPFFAVMGTAFLLLETKSITSFSLLFGATWITNSVVIAAILIAILGANALVAYRRAWVERHIRWVFACIGAALALNYVVPLHVMLVDQPVLRVLVAGSFVGLPLLGAAVIFAHYFDRCANLPAALASNLTGCIIGGLGEYSSLALGYQSLYLGAAVAYGLAFVLRPRA